MRSKCTFFILAFIATGYIAPVLNAQDSTKAKQNSVQHGQRFVDKDGDGYNDNAPDHDGDGVPNGLDPDWKKSGKGKGGNRRFVDLDGDGINDNLQSKDHEKSGHQERNRDGSGARLEGEKQKRQLQKKQRSGR